MLTKDVDNIICQREPDGFLDGGDSVNWTAHYLYMQFDPEWSPELFEEHFEVSPGLWVRHPNKYRSRHGWAAYSGGTYDGVLSRDQMTGILCYLGKNKRYRAIINLAKQHLKRGFFFANNTFKNGKDPSKAKRKLPDITLFTIWALFIRGLYPYSLPLYPLLLLCDLQLVLDSIIKRFSNESNDVISFFIKAVYANERMPTPWVWVINRVTSMAKTNRLLHEYWCGWRGNCDMYDRSTKYLYKYFKG